MRPVGGAWERGQSEGPGNKASWRGLGTRPVGGAWERGQLEDYCTGYPVQYTHYTVQYLYSTRYDLRSLLMPSQHL